MNPAIDLDYRNILTKEIIFKRIRKFSARNERQILKVFLLGCFHKLCFDFFRNQLLYNQNYSLLECYDMDSKIIQILIQDIIETGDYTLEGIAHSTHIPFDVIYEAACGISNQFSITPWARVVDLYMQVKPDIAQVLIDKLLELIHKNRSEFSLLLTEK